jgi:cytoskeletal protein RodZ
LTGIETWFIVDVEISPGKQTVFWSAMSSFGKDLRKARMSRGVALEHITAVTKINPRYLEALEGDHFDLLPGGILSRGIVRGYAAAAGLNQQEWTERFLRDSAASGQAVDDDSNWTEFASNVGKARIQRSNAMERRLRWIGAILLLLMGGAGAFLAVRYYGLSAGWWPTLMPMDALSVHALLARFLSRVKL